jgi:hypothetical protein
MQWDWYDAPGVASSMVTAALGAVIAAGTVSEARVHTRLAALGLLAFAATLMLPFLAEADGPTS